MSPSLDQTPIILLSGMGADERVFTPQLEAFGNLQVPRWIEPEPNESLAQYAERFARKIDPGGPCFIGGASFGGFVAIEMARHLEAKACFLIGSVRSPAELPIRIRALRPLRGATRFMPFGLACRLVGVGVTAFGSISAPTTRAFLQQASESDARFLRWATRAVLSWEGKDLGNLHIHQIHGRNDHVLPASRTQPDVIVEGAGHVLSLTHAKQVNDFIRSNVERYVPAQSSEF